MHGMKSRHGAARLGAGAAAVALAAASAVAFSTPAAATEDAPAAGTSSAYGIDANLAVTGTELLNVDPTPYVESQGERQQDEVLEVPAEPLLNLKVLETVAEGSHARATAVNLKALEETIKAKVLEATCTGGEGNTKVVELIVGGETVIGDEAQPEPNTTVNIPPEQLQQLEQVAKAQLILNKQEELDNGGIQVTALELKANIAGETVTKDISISSVACGPDTSQPKPSETDKVEDGDEAPKPKPVEGDLAVTG